MRYFRLSTYVLMALLLISAVPSFAQSAPTPNKTIDAAFADASARLGVNYTRNNLQGRWNWDYIAVQGANLGCANPVSGSAPSASVAYVVRLNLRQGYFEYRASRDESIFIVCAVPVIQATAQPTLPPQPTFQPLQATPVPPSAAATTYTQAIAYINPDGNLYVNSATALEGGTRLTNDAARVATDRSPFYEQARAYGSLRWSPDGSALLFMEARGNTLYIARSGQPAQMLFGGLANGFPSVWSPDGSEFAYVVATAQPAANGGFIYQVQAQPREGGSPRVAGSFAFTDGCATDRNPDPAEAIYRREMRAPFESPLALFWTPNGFLHSTGCRGEGIALTDFNGQRLWEQPNVIRSALAPDGSALAVVVRPPSGARYLTLLSPTDGTERARYTVADVEQVGWTLDSEIVLYSTAALDPSASVVGDINAPQGSQLLEVWPLDGVSYQLALYALSAVTPDPRPVELFRGSGRAVLNLNGFGDNVLFTVVTDSAPLVAAINRNAQRPEILQNAPTVLSAVGGLARQAVLDASLPLPSASSSGGVVGQGQLTAGGGTFAAVGAP